MISHPQSQNQGERERDVLKTPEDSADTDVFLMLLSLSDDINVKMLNLVLLLSEIPGHG